MVEWYFYNFTKLFLKDINNNIIAIFTVTVTTESDKRSVTFLSFEVSPTACSYCKVLDFNVNVWWRYWDW